MAEERGKMLKVLFVDGDKKPVAESSQQLPEDPFEKYHNRGLVDPPYPLEQLLYLAETHPMHAASIEQKTADIVGTGYEWRPRDGVENPNEKQRDELDEWFLSLFPDGDPTPQEAFSALQDDVETFAQGYLEVARDPSGVAKRIYNVPAHTVRFHQDGLKLAQVRRNRLAWFRRWGATDDYVDSRYGSVNKNVESGKRANDLLVVRRRSRRSSYYGVPTYISAIGWVMLALAARDDNLLFFQNRREPRWAIVLSNLDEEDGLEEEIRRAFTVDLKDPHRNIIIPIAGPGKVDFQKMSSDRAEGSFGGLAERADAQILVSHRIPPERLGMARVGPLGGNIALASSRIYKEAVVSPSQGLLAARVNAFIAREWPGGGRGKEPSDKKRDKALDWEWAPVELDLAEAVQDAERAKNLFTANIIVLEEARSISGFEPLPDDDPRNKKLAVELGAQPSPEEEAAGALNQANSRLDQLLTAENERQSAGTPPDDTA